MLAYRNVLNSLIKDIWNTIEWKEKPIKGKKQYRLVPYYGKSREFRRTLRDRYLIDWPFASHWIDSALKTAYSIIDSWRKNYLKGDRKREKPQARRLFLRVKQTLCKLEGDRLRITLDGKGGYAHIDLSRRYFKLPDNISSDGMGEPVITPDTIYLPIHCRSESGEESKHAEKIAWDSNFLSVDGYSPETGWVKIDTKALASAHISAFEKRRSVQRKASKSKKAKRILAKYSRRERNRAKKHRIEIARVISSLSNVNCFEDLRKEKMYTGSKVWNRMVTRANWKGVVRRLREVGCRVKVIEPAYSTRRCSRCGCTNIDLRGEVFECEACGLRIDRQLNAAINLYLRMEGVPHDKVRWDRNILPTLVGGYFLTGAERNGVDELARSLYDAVRPKLYYAYNRYADAYLRVPT